MSTEDAYRLATLATHTTALGTITTAGLPSGGGSHSHPYSDPDHTHASGSHPDLATHTGLGLAVTHAHDYAGSGHAHDYEPLHAHPYSSTGHNHDGSYAPTHSHPYEAAGTVSAHVAQGDPHPVYLTSAEGDALYVHSHPYAATSHAHVDGDIPASIARDTEVATAVTNHEAASNPHATYATDADLTTHAAGPHGGGGTWTSVIKTADENHNSSATVADDALLRFTTLANTNYAVRLRAHFLTNATADLKYRLVHTGTTTRVRRLVRRTATTDIAVTVVRPTAFDAADVILSTTGLNPWLEEDVILQVGASPGVFKLQWAQVTSNAGPTTCLEGSYLEYAVT